MATRISDANEYIKETYGAYQNKSTSSIMTMGALLQDDFEGNKDCTLTSITEITRYHSAIKHPEKIIYNKVKEIAKKYGYTDNHGTFSITVNKIVNEVNQVYKIEKKSKCAYFKGVGYTIKTIMKNISNKTPLILNMMNDGRDYYKNHSVTVVGYADFVVNGKHIYLLEVHDNWSNKSSFIDYQKLCIISSLNYCK